MSRSRSALRVASLLLLGSGGFIAASPLISSYLPVSIIAVGAIGTVLCLGIRGREEGWPKRELGLLASLFALFVLGFPLATIETEYGAQKALGVLLLIPLLSVGGVALMTDRLTRKLYVSGTVVIGILAAGLALVEPDEAAATLSRLSIEGSTIGLGRAVGAAVVVLLAAALSARRTQLWILLLGAVALTSILLQVGSRGPVVAAVITVAVLYGLRNRVKFVLALVIFAVVASWVVDLASDGVVSDRLLDITLEESDARYQLASISWLAMLRNPLGVGWGSLEKQLESAARVDGTTYSYPHNILLELGAEAGWLPLLGFVFALAVALVRQFRRIGTPREDCIFGLTIFFFLNALASNDLVDNRAMWILIGASLIIHVGSFRSPSPSAPGVSSRSIAEHGQAPISGRPTAS